jgi:predicted RNA-binding protein YlqC (UPF0109 family)
MDKLLTFLVTAIVTKPEAVKITRTEINGVENFNLSVDPEDMKIVIGKQGQTIRAIRHLLRLKAIRESSRVNLLLEEGRTPS